MKKLLTLLGAVAISGSAGASTVVAVNTSSNSNTTIKSTLNINPIETNISLQIMQLRNSYNSLSDSEKLDVANVMKELPNLSTIEIGQYLANSNIEFIKQNKIIIENMFILSNSFNTISNSLSVSTQSLNVDWGMINQFIDLDFGNSNEYTPLVDTYGPSNWWKFWEWGWKIDFPEGDINIMRVVKLLVSLYDGINFEPLESLLETGRTFFDYLVNLDQHDDDKVAVLHDLLIKTETEFKNSKIPFTQDLYDILDQFSSILKILREQKISLIKNIIKSTIQDKLGISLEEISAEYSGYLDQIINIMHITNNVLDIIHGTLPGIIWNFIMDGILLISTEMINADSYHNGVNLKFQQFIIPLGFESR